jgi:hypothetical protein
VAAGAAVGVGVVAAGGAAAGVVAVAGTGVASFSSFFSCLISGVAAFGASTTGSGTGGDSISLSFLAKLEKLNSSISSSPSSLSWTIFLL